MGFPSIKEFFEKEEYPHKERIAGYLLDGGKAGAVSAGIPKDFFTGEHIQIEVAFRNDIAKKLYQNPVEEIARIWVKGK